MTGEGRREKRLLYAQINAQIVAIDLESGLQYGAADPRREGTVIDLPEDSDKGGGKK